MDLVGVFTETRRALALGDDGAVDANRVPDGLIVVAPGEDRLHAHVDRPIERFAERVDWTARDVFVAELRDPMRSRVRRERG